MVTQQEKMFSLKWLVCSVPLKDDSVALSRKASINERIFDVDPVRA
jgi:hypothetical protein